MTSSQARSRSVSLRPADEAEAVFLEATGAVPGGQKVQLVDHMVMASDEATIDPGRLQDRQIECPFQELSASSVVNKREIAAGEPHRKRATGHVIGTQITGE